jgi:hypothetical protein
MPPKEGLLLINFYFIDKNLDPSTAGPNTSLSLVRCGNNVFQSDSCIEIGRLYSTSSNNVSPFIIYMQPQ